MKKFIIFFATIFLLFSCNIEKNESENMTNTGIVIDENTVSGILDQADNQNSNTGTEVQENKYCILDECIPLNLKIEEKGDFYVAVEKGEEYFREYKVSKDFEIFEKNISEQMLTVYTKIFKIGDSYIKSIDTRGCGGTNLDQKIYNKDLKEITDFIFPGFDKEIKIGNIVYKPTLIGNGGEKQPFGTSNAFKIFKDKDNKNIIYNNVSDFQKDAENKSINELKKVYKSYVAEYNDYKGIYIFYNSVGYDESSIRVVWLGTDSNYLSKNIKQNGDYIDLAITNKIIGYYSNGNEGVFDSEGNVIKSVTIDKLPIFKMKKLNDVGNYLVYFNDGYKLQSFAEMCKPLVYYYSKNNEGNKLSLNPKKGDYFTKLIPELDKNNSWNFTSKNGIISVNNKKYDYLYYSLVNVGYEHNKDGWIVKGDEIVKFFNDKLDKINFSKKEKTDFIDYWKDKYSSDKYYFVSFKYKQDLDKIIKLDFSKKVDNEFRVLLDSYELLDFSYERYEDFLYENVADKFDKFLIQKFERGIGSNEVFEWGGVLVKKEETIIK